MKNAILVDLDIITEYLRTGKGILPVAYDKYDMKITTVTYTELLASKTFEDQNLEKEVQDFVKKYFTVINIDENTSIRAASLLRQYDIPLAQAIIAATSIEHSLDMLTGNKKEYEKIAGVTLLELDN